MMVCIIVTGSISFSNAQTYTWQGEAGDQSWQDEQNWTGSNGVPNSSNANVWFDDTSTAGGGPLNIDFESATAIQLDSIRTSESTEAVTIRNFLSGPLEIHGNNGSIANDILTNIGGESLTIDADFTRRRHITSPVA